MERIMKQKTYIRTLEILGGVFINFIFKVKKNK